MKTKLSWFAGLIDGEGCFTVSVRKHHKSTLKITPIFSIQMKDGSWVEEVIKILNDVDVKHYVRKRKNQIEISVKCWKNIIPLIRMLLPFSIVKKPLMKRFLTYRPKPVRNRFIPPDPKIIGELAELIDFVRNFNRGKNRPYKWTGKRILEFFKINNKIARRGISGHCLLNHGHPV